MNEEELKRALQGLLNKGMVFRSFNLKKGKIVEVFSIRYQPNIKYVCDECGTALTKKKYCPICEAEELFGK